MKRLKKNMTGIVFVLALVVGFFLSVQVQASEVKEDNDNINDMESISLLSDEGYDTLYVSTDGSNLNVRSGAGTEYSIVGKLGNGTRIKSWSIFGRVDSQGYGWTQIRATSTTGVVISGWVRDDYLTTTPPSRSISNILETVLLADVG